MQGGELRSSLPDARPTANRLVMPPDLSGRRAEVEGGEERPEIFPAERRQGGGCCGFPNAKSEEDPTRVNLVAEMTRVARNVTTSQNCEFSEIRELGADSDSEGDSEGDC